MYLRDEETGEIWSPTPLPGGNDTHYRVHHGAGYTIFEHNSNGLIQRLKVFASPTDPVKIIQLSLQNTWNRPRRITTTQYVGWVLGTAREANQQYILSEYDISHEAILSTNMYNAEFKDRVAFLAASKAIHGLTADRTEFLGRNGLRRDPIGLRRIGLEARTTAGEDPCGVLQMHIDLDPGQSEEVYFLLGQGDNRQHALDLVEQYHQIEKVNETWEQVERFWDDLLGTIQVTTPDEANNLILNRWLVYQTLSCRIWGRTGFYQSSGAFGFRDQLQDVMAILPIKPDIARSHILLAASYQFEEGDVLHWWHPPSGRGVRTRISDDLLWLPYVTSEYIRTTGDSDILDEKVPFLKGDILKPGEEERYNLYSHTAETYPLLEHCLRAIQKGTDFRPAHFTIDWDR